MNDWIGLAFFIVLIVGAIIGLKIIANPKPRTAEEFEKSAADNPSFTGALLNALHDVTDPASKRSKEVRMQMKDGNYMKKKREGKADSDAEAGENTENEEQI